MKCNNCGAENKANSKFCEECGKSLNNAHTSNGGYMDILRKNRNLVLVALVVMVLLVAVVGYSGLSTMSSTLALNNTTKVNNSNTNQISQSNLNPESQPTRAVCSVCGGSGTSGVCSTCGGTGTVPCSTPWLHGGADNCPNCDGHGNAKCPGGQGPCKDGNRVCGACGGDGYSDSGDPGPMM